MAGHPPGTAPHPPSGTQPRQGMQPKGTVLGPHTHCRAHSTWVAAADNPPGGRAVGEGRCLTSDAPHDGERHPPQGRPSTTPTAPNACPQRCTLWGGCRVTTPAPTAPGTHGSRNPTARPRAHAVGRMLGPHARGNRTQDTRVAEPRLPAQENGRPGEGQRLAPDAPHNGGRQPPPPRARPPTTLAARSPDRA